MIISVTPIRRKGKTEAGYATVVRRKGKKEVQSVEPLRAAQEEWAAQHGMTIR